MDRQQTQVETEILRQVISFRPIGFNFFKLVEMRKKVNSNLPCDLEIHDIEKVLDKFYSNELLQKEFELPWEEFGEMIEKQRKSEIESVQEEISHTQQQHRKRSTRKK